MRLMRAVCTAVAVVLVTAGAFADCVSLLQPVSQPNVFPNRAAGPIAWNGSEYGIAKTEGTQARPVFFGRLDSELNSISPDTTVASSSRAGALALFWTGSEYTLFYETKDPRLVMQRISAAGTLIGGPIFVADAHGIWPDREIDITWDKSRNAYAIVYTIPQGASRGLWLTIVEPNGTIRTDTLVNSFVLDPIAPQVAATSAGLVILFHHSTTGLMHSTVYRADGTFTQAFAVSPIGSNGQLEWNGSQLAYVVSSPITGGSEIRWTRLDANGNTVVAQTRMFQALGSDAAPVHLVWNPEDREWALAYRDSYLGFSQLPGDYRIGRFTASGARLSDTYFSPQQVFASFETIYPFIWTGSAYVSTVGRTVSTTAGTQSYAVRNCPVRISILSSHRSITINDEIRLDAIVSGGVAPFTYEWDLGETSLGTLGGATVKHRYRNTGRYTVTLTVTDSLGARAVTTTTIDVFVPKRRAVRK
jgi:hypothetical protein